MREAEITHFIGLGGANVKLRGKTQARLALEFQQKADAEIARLQEANQISGSANTHTEELPPYEEWSLKELQTEASSRGLVKTGKKEELVARLIENDEAEDDEDEEVGE